MVDTRSERRFRDPFPRWSLLIALSSALAAFAVVLSGQASSTLQYVEQLYSDVRTSLLSERSFADHPDIVLVSIGENVDATRSTFGQRAELDRARLARLIEIIDDAAPRAIGIDVPFGGPTDQVKDQALQRTLREAKARVVFGVREEASGASAERRAYSDRFIAGTGRAVGHIASLYEGDRVVRFDSGALALSRTPDSFAVLMARALRPEVRRNFGRIAWLQKVDPNGWVTRWVNVAAQHPFRMFYGEEIIDNPKTLPVRALAGRLVMITSGFSDVERHRTPLTVLSGEAVPAIQVQAQAAAQLLDGRTVGDMPARTTRLMLFTLALLAGIVGWYRGLRTSIAGWLLALVALVVADVFAYSWLALTLPAVQMIAAWFLGEAAGRGLRRILVWEEANGRPWPIEDTGDPGIFSAGTVRKEQA